MDVLIADDDPVSLHLLKSKLLKWRYQVVTCTEGVEALRILRSPACPRLAILDWMMPGLDGPQICQQIRKQTDMPYVYIIILTTRGHLDDVVSGLEAGADDYVIKPFKVEELEVRLRAGRRIIDLQEELMAAKEALRIQATHDQLTGMLNRAAVLDQLGRELARAQREQMPISVSIIDLDHFKIINDTCGHLVGDEVLVEATRRMRSCIRPYDVIGRLGGEEFLVVLPGSDAATAMAQASRVQEAVRSGPYQVADGVLEVTCSQGVTTWPGAGETQIADLLKTADGGLYLAKHGGRNRVEFLEFNQAKGSRHPETATS